MSKFLALLAFATYASTIVAAFVVLFDDAVPTSLKVYVGLGIATLAVFVAYKVADGLKNTKRVRR